MKKIFLFIKVIILLTFICSYSSAETFQKELSKLIEYGYKLSEGSTMSPQVKLMVDIVKEEYGIDLSQQKGQRPTASTAELNQMKIDARIKRFKAGRSVKENKIFDMLIT